MCDMDLILYLKRYAYYLIVILFAAFICVVSFKFINGNILVKVVLEIFVCSIIVNTIFYITFRKTAEFEKLRIVIKNILKKINIKRI